MQNLRLRDFRRVVVLTGAGVSVASGLPTYRGPQGLWQDPEKRALATAQAQQDDPDKLWGMFSKLRTVAREAEPNAAHLAIAGMQDLLGDGGMVTVVTQNVDGLHQRAGSSNVVELHGSVLRSRCADGGCSLPGFEDQTPPAETAPRCPVCQGPLRADVVLFDEPLGGAQHLATRALRDCDLFLAVGTSGTVYPAANFVRSAEYAGARTVYINLEPLEPPNASFQEQRLGRCEELLPRLFANP